MSAEMLREAAAGIRSDAHKATPGRWKAWGMQVLADQDGTSNAHTAVPVASFLTCDDAGRPRTWDLDHVIGMQPAVALAVADWLDVQAERVEVGFCGKVGAQALAVAAAYLGRES